MLDRLDPHYLFQHFLFPSPKLHQFSKKSKQNKIFYLQNPVQQTMELEKNLWFIICVLFTCFSLNSRVSYGADKITTNQTLSGDQTILSAGGTFKLGFFRPSNSSKNYIGMWYDKLSIQTVVWVANREIPVSDRYNSELKIMDGNLVLLNESKVPIWSTNVTSTSTKGAVEAVLQEDGNLVLKDGSGSSELLWESFEHPGDTWIPGAKIGWNNKTGVTTRLTSWKNIDDPAPGLFSLELDPNGTNSYFIFWNKTRRFWSSGPWNGRIFSDVPEMRLNYLYNFSYVTNENESYFTYSLYDSTKISRFSMDVLGQIKQYTWLDISQQWNLFWSMPRQRCEVYALCGPYGECKENAAPYCECLQGFEPNAQEDWSLQDYSGGCKRKTALQCANSGTGNKKQDKFLPIANTKLPEDPENVAAGTGSASTCESTCLSNCSCVAYAYESNSCSIWRRSLLNAQQLSDNDSQGKTLNLKLAASEFPSPKSNKGTVIGAALGSAGIVALLGVLFLILRKRRRAMIKTKAVDGTLVAFEYRDLQTATKNFSEKLGGGGFGSVFKGTLPDSSIIAVKKLESISQGEKQFRSEVSTIGTIQHVNLVRLRGFCSEGTKKLLVYDYMPNGSLDTQLLHENQLKVLDWKTRYQIALGTARGLVYLHEKCRDCIIHCDIKPENILLDADFVPKVADFGLAKLVGREFSRVLTTMRGTRGYLAPEWISGVAVTAKADVYSYGMMLFEIVSGRRNSQQSEDGKVNFFPTWAANLLIQGGDLIPLLDPKLEGNADEQEVSRICKVACWCIQDDENHRPSMSQVVQILEGVLDVNTPPVPRSLQVFVDNEENLVFFTDSSTRESSKTQSNASTTSSQSKSNTNSQSS